MVVESMMLQYPEFRAGPPVVSKDGNVVVFKKTGSKGGGKFSPKSSTSMSTSTRFSSSSSMSSGRASVADGVRCTEADDAPANDDGEEFLDAICEGNEDDDAAEDDQTDDEQDQEQDGDNDAAADLGELAQVLTLTAKTLSSLTLGRKSSGRTPSSKGNGKSGGSSSSFDKKVRSRLHQSRPLLPLTPTGTLHHEHGATEVTTSPATV